MKAAIFSGFPQDWAEQVPAPVESLSGELDEMLDAQRHLMGECLANRIPNDTLLYITLNNIVGEANEAAAFYGDITKPWKVNMGVNLDEIQEELIDILHFLLQAFIITGMTGADIVSLYHIKNNVNFRRIKAKREENEGV